MIYTSWGGGNTLEFHVFVPSALFWYHIFRSDWDYSTSSCSNHLFYSEGTVLDSSLYFSSPDEFILTHTHTHSQPTKQTKQTKEDSHTGLNKSDSSAALKRRLLPGSSEAALPHQNRLFMHFWAAPQLSGTSGVIEGMLQGLLHVVCLSVCNYFWVRATSWKRECNLDKSWCSEINSSNRSMTSARGANTCNCRAWGKKKKIPPELSFR